LIRAILGALTGAAAAAAALLLFTLFDPAITLEMNRDVSRPLASGLYPVEEYGDDTYAWTRPLATFNFREIDRRSAWRCTVRIRGARPAGVPQPDVLLGIDGLTVLTHSAGPHYEKLEIVAPSRPGRGLSLSISANPPFVPPADPRQLGVQLDHLECRPADGGWVLPPERALIVAAVTGAGFGMLFGLLAGTGIMALACGVFGSAAAWILQTGTGEHAGAYLEWILPLALCVSASGVVVAVLAARRLSGAARFVLGFSPAILFLKLAALMHPSKAIVDAVFHAHRLEWVLDGRYFFTQPMPGGVQFPYAIALYITASPFASIITDHVALLRIVVCFFEALAAGLLYLVVARAWGDRTVAAASVVFYHSVPLPYAVIGNANLTYAFGHSISMIAFALVSVLSFRWQQFAAILALFIIASVAFLSHVAVFPLLGMSLVATGVLYAFRRDPAVRPFGLPVIVIAVLAAVLAFVLYYAHFPEVYQTLDRVRSVSAETTMTPQAGPPAASAAPLSIPARGLRAVWLGIRDLGVPIALLAVAGVWLRFRAGGDRLNLVLAAWGLSFLFFVGFRIVAPVDPRLQRYADEFIDRVYYATLPAIVILAAYAAGVGFQKGGPWRLLAVCVSAGAVVYGILTASAWIT
jgi:hypothetical protein